MIEVMMEVEGGELFSGCSSTTTTPLNDDDLAGQWADWASVVDWGTLANPADDFHSLIDSMLCDYNHEFTAGNSTAATGSISSTTTSCPSSPRSDEEDDVKGLRLVHLLTAAAEAMAAPAKDGRELARVILVRLKELLPVNAGGGATMERLAVHFTDALLGLLDGGARHRDNHHHHHHHSNHDVIAAFQLLQDMSPYVKFGHFTANQAILEAVAGDRRVHIVDYDIMEGIQWASLMQALATRKDGPPAPHLRITAVTRSGAGGAAKRPMSSVQETGRRLAAFAASIGQPFSFSHCRLDSDEKFRPAGVKVVKGEALVVNCMLHVPHTPERSPASVASFLAGAASLRPRVVTLVEEEEEEEEEEGFMGRFMAALHRYSAVCDSLEAGFPMHGRARGLVERVFLGPRIAGAVGRAFKGKDGDGGGGGWAERMAAMGFRGVGISFFNVCQARLLLGLFHDGYRVEETAANKLVLGWKSRRLLSASVWLAPVAGGEPAMSGGVKEGGGDGEEFDGLMMQWSPSI